MPCVVYSRVEIWKFVYIPGSGIYHTVLLDSWVDIITLAKLPTFPNIQGYVFLNIQLYVFHPISLCNPQWYKFNQQHVYSRVNRDMSVRFECVYHPLPTRRVFQLLKKAFVRRHSQAPRTATRSTLCIVPFNTDATSPTDFGRG